MLSIKQAAKRGKARRQLIEDCVSSDPTFVPQSPEYYLNLITKLRGQLPGLLMQLTAPNQPDDCTAGLTSECCLCGATNCLEKSHVYSNKHGGTYNQNNIIWTCRDCNLTTFTANPIELDMYQHGPSVIRDYDTTRFKTAIYLATTMFEVTTGIYKRVVMSIKKPKSSQLNLVVTIDAEISARLDSLIEALMLTTTLRLSTPTELKPQRPLKVMNVTKHVVPRIVNGRYVIDTFELPMIPDRQLNLIIKLS